MVCFHLHIQPNYSDLVAFLYFSHGNPLQVFFGSTRDASFWENSAYLLYITLFSDIFRLNFSSSFKLTQQDLMKGVDWRQWNQETDKHNFITFNDKQSWECFPLQKQNSLELVGGELRSFFEGFLQYVCL